MGREIARVTFRAVCDRSPRSARSTRLDLAACARDALQQRPTRDGSLLHSQAEAGESERATALEDRRANAWPSTVRVKAAPRLRSDWSARIASSSAATSRSKSASAMTAVATGWPKRTPRAVAEARSAGVLCAALVQPPHFVAAAAGGHRAPAAASAGVEEQPSAAAPGAAADAL